MSSFNSQPPEGGWPLTDAMKRDAVKFQLTAARRRLDSHTCGIRSRENQFQLTAARRRLAAKAARHECGSVSTHSRPKAAGRCVVGDPGQTRASFNSQPPEGGWSMTRYGRANASGDVSTHSRPKAAGRPAAGRQLTNNRVSTHSRPKAAGLAIGYSSLCPYIGVSTHSRPKAAGRLAAVNGNARIGVSTHSRPKAAGAVR